MKLFLTCLLGIVFFFLPVNSKAQPQQGTPALTAKTDSVKTDSAKAGVSGNTTSPDDDFTPVVFLVAVALASLIVGAIIVGAFATASVLALVFVMVSAGVVSAAVFTGLYKKSVAAGFKTLCVLVCALGGIVAGGFSFGVINHYFHLHLIPHNAVLLGAAGGLLGGLLLGIILYWIIRALIEMFRQKLALRL